MHPEVFGAAVAVEVREQDLLAWTADAGGDLALRQPGGLGGVQAGVWAPGVEEGGHGAGGTDPEVLGAAVTVEVGEVHGVGGVAGHAGTGGADFGGDGEEAVAARRDTGAVGGVFFAETRGQSSMPIWDGGGIYMAVQVVAGYSAFPRPAPLGISPWGIHFGRWLQTRRVPPLAVTVMGSLTQPSLLAVEMASNHVSAIFE